MDIDFSRPEFNFTARLADATKSSYRIGYNSPVIGMVGPVLFNLETSRIDIPFYIGSNDLIHKNLHPSAKSDLPGSIDVNTKDRMQKLGGFLPVIEMSSGVITHKIISRGYLDPEHKVLDIYAFGCLPLDRRHSSPKFQQLLTALSTCGLVAAMLKAPSLSLTNKTQIDPGADDEMLSDARQKLLASIESRDDTFSFYSDY